MDNTVYVVHCIDTEGPLYESIESVFDRLNSTFGTEFKPSIQVLEQLQKQQIDLKGNEKAVSDFLDPQRLKTNETWCQIDEMLDRITKKEFRQKYCDSFGGGWIYNWFCLDYVGYNGINPRRRDVGPHNIFDHYRLYNKINSIEDDLIQWHYHPLAIIKDLNKSGTTYLNSSNVHEILARKIIDRMWFPAAFRPGFHTERPDSNWFLEQWIPFDYANQSTKDNKENQPDLLNQRFGDWRNASTSWVPYNPDIYNYQKIGNCRRLIARCLNMDARIRELTKNDISDAFCEAQEKGAALLAFTDHDFRDIEYDVNKVGSMIKDVSGQYSNVKFKYVNAIEGIRKVMNLNNRDRPDFTLDIERFKNLSTFYVKSKNDIFGVQPFLAIKTKTNQYFWENFDFEGKNSWSYTFDYANININAVEKIGVAANTMSGVTEIGLLDVDSNRATTSVLNS